MHGMNGRRGSHAQAGSSLVKTLRMQSAAKCAKNLGRKYRNSNLWDTATCTVQDGKPTHWVGIDFRGIVDPAEAKIGEPHKCDGLRWVTLEELNHFPEPLHSHFPLFLEKYRDAL